MFYALKHIMSINDIPDDWIFSHYLGLPKLTGQSIKIKSIFNERDTVPSLVIYYDRKTERYKFKDFSSGHSGRGIHLMMLIWNCSFNNAFNRIKNDYINNDNYISDIDKENIKYQGWIVKSYVPVEWNKYNYEYWKDYYISIDMLKEHNVVPIKSYIMAFQIEDEIIEEFEVKNKCIYGYLYGNSINNLAKIYQPLNSTKKFIKVNNYIQGSEQNDNNQYCFIISSLKDIMALKTIGIKADMYAPDSENTMLSNYMINKFINNYGKDNILVIFDNDKPGIEAMKKYNEMYGLKYCYIPYEKDPALILKNNGIDEARRRIVPYINKKLNESLEILR